jgi:WD40 repeat protein
MSLRSDNKKINNILVTSQGYKFSTVKWINTGYLASGTWDSEKTEIAIWRKDVSIKKSPPYLSIYAKGNLDSEIFQVDATETLSVSACSDGYLRFHKTVVKADVASALITSQPANFKHELGCTCAKISQHLSISGGGDGYVCAYDSELHKLVWSNKENSQSEEIRDLCFINQNGFDFASTSSSVEIRLFDVRTNKTALLLFPL